MNYTINKILVAIDFSETSLNTLDTAAMLAKKNNAELLFLNVVDTSFEFAAENAYGLGTTAPSANQFHILEAVAETVADRHGIKPKIISDEGLVYVSIIKASIIHQADLIIMGAHGASGPREYFLGSNAVNVIKVAGCPVLCLPLTRKSYQFRNIVFPARPVIGALSRYDVIKNIMSENEPTITILGISDNGRSAVTIESLAEDLAPELETDHVKMTIKKATGRNIAEEILRVSASINADLVVIPSAIDVSSKQFYLGPYTQRLINHSRVPLLSVRKVGSPAFA